MKRVAAMLAMTWLLGAFATVAHADPSMNFRKKCASCHGPDGKGQTKMGEKLQIKDLTDPKVQAGFSDAQAVKDVTEGTKDKKTGKDRMPVFKDKLSGDDIKELVAFVRTLKAH